MEFISEKSRRAPRSLIREMFAMQAGMEDVVSFALGEPDFPAPKHVIEAVTASFQREGRIGKLSGPGPGLQP